MSTEKENKRKEHVRNLTRQDVVNFMDKTDIYLLEHFNRTAFGLERFIQRQHYLSSEKKIDFEVFAALIESASRVCCVRQSNHLGSVQKFLRMLTGCEKFLFDDVLLVLNKCIDRKQDISLPLLMKNYISILKVVMKGEFPCIERIVNYVFPAMQNILNILKCMRIKDLEIVIDEYDKLKREVEIYERPSPLSGECDEDAVQLFRNLSILPRENDVVNVIIEDLPCNIIDGPYRSVNHYLSVHFRLMREDMLRSFRECIKMITNNSDSSKFGVRVYEKVNARYPPKYTPDGICVRIDISTSKEVDWSRKDVLTPGSLVCLTPNNFNTVFFATMRKFKSSINKSKSASADILFDDIDENIFKKGDDYLMCEPSAYFESYKHVLSTIKEFSLSNFPLSDILVHLDFDNAVPEYLLYPEKWNIKEYCLHENKDNDNYKLIPASKKVREAAASKKGTGAEKWSINASKSDESLEDTGKKFEPLNDSDWPSAEEMKLDDQQHKAFMTALTKKVAVIQGPPGTGKTYIGVKIVKALLENVPHTPIIISCQTNHALDQFLERILPFTKNIVRLGSQSKSEDLEPHYLDNLIRAHREYNTIQDMGYNMDLEANQILKKSLDQLQTFTPAILQGRNKNESDADYFNFQGICNTLNKLYSDLSLCKSKYLDESALNMIIGREQKRQLRSRFSTDSKTLCASIMEWLDTNRSSDLYLKCEKRFEKIRKISNLVVDEDPDNVFHLNLEERFKLFYVWREKCLNALEENIAIEKKSYEEKKQLYEGRILDPVKAEILRNSFVIGVTTTGAAKYRKLICSTEPAILIVEEAAEVLESHIIAALSPTTKHLILIGDHKQLRPIPANHELSEYYNLKISMFERLFNNNAPAATLVTQHRMKPCIADLLVHEDLYSELINYENVYKYEDIKGMKSSMFFLDHLESEDEKSSGTSASNKFEALMIVSLAKYLCTQSYTSEQITILATYAAQVLLIQTLLMDENLEILVATVDNYQGEENDIVLISFVRNNKIRAVGFLKENNRVCVALSRARKGMYCFGNFTMYAEKSSLWKSIVNKVEVQKMSGNKMALQCHRHGIETLVGTSSEVLEFMQYGCKEKCGFKLPCDHVCVRKCHNDDSDHLKYRCPMPCEKYISDNKKCPRMCYERCKRGKKQTVLLHCGHPGRLKNDGSVAACVEEYQKCLPCNHIDTIPCTTDLTKYKCKAAVPILLSCGHKKLIECYKSKEKVKVKCTELKPVIGPCDHIIDIPCYLDLEGNELLAYCKKACGKLLKCGHPCVGDCCWCLDTGIHAICREKCSEVLNCGHVCSGLCGSPCPPCEKRCSLLCYHKELCCVLCFPLCVNCNVLCNRLCIHVLKYTECINQCGRPCRQCQKLCERKCPHHICEKLCFEECFIGPCSNFCDVILSCGHQCLGMCGDPCPFPCIKCDKDVKSGNPDTDHFIQLLDCEHIIEINEITDHISTCLDCFMWPDCPVCSQPIFTSLRFRGKLKQAREAAITFDNSDEVDHVSYLFHSMYGSALDVPVEFRDVHRKISNILLGEKPSSGTLLVLKHCLGSLQELITINQKLKENLILDIITLRNRFDTLLIWISRHLTRASYQQLDELDNAIAALKSKIAESILVIH